MYLKTSVLKICSNQKDKIKQCPASNQYPASRHINRQEDMAHMGRKISQSRPSRTDTNIRISRQEH